MACSVLLPKMQLGCLGGAKYFPVERLHLRLPMKVDLHKHIQAFVVVIGRLIN